MRNSRVNRRLAFCKSNTVRKIGCLLAGILCTGCGNQGYERYVPPAPAAREALAAALSAWQQGQAPGTIDTRSPPVQVVDDHRHAGQLLRGYEILGELSDDNTRCFVVRLNLDNPLEEQKVRYRVVGVNPLWVLREEDYEMLLHWDHPMGPEKQEK